ncbi:MAG: hypothetical protein KGJ07_00485 [Patescibacteria group bacterium]|nr:hypothetical protein [Patescibacteria group bacterium]
MTTIQDKNPNFSKPIFKTILIIGLVLIAISLIIVPTGFYKIAPDFIFPLFLMVGVVLVIISSIVFTAVDVQKCPTCNRWDEVHRTDNLIYDKVISAESALRKRLPKTLDFFVCLRCESTFGVDK